MKVNIQNYAKRFFPVIVSLCIILTILAYPTFAASTVMSYKDLLSKTVVDGDNVIYELNVDRYATKWRVNYSGNYIGLNGYYCEYGFENNQKFNLQCYPLGGYGSDIKSLSLQDVPAGTSVALFAQITSVGQYLTPSISCFINYYDSSGNWISADKKELGLYTTPYDINATFTLSIPSNAVSFTPSFVIYNLGGIDGGVYYYVSLSSFSMTLTMTNAMVESLKTDVIITGSQEQQNAANQAGQNVSNAVGDLNAAGDAMTAIDKPNVNIDSLVPDDLTSDVYLAYTGCISKLWNDEVLTAMVGILVGMILISYLLHGKKEG